MRLVLAILVIVFLGTSAEAGPLARWRAQRQAQASCSSAATSDCASAMSANGCSSAASAVRFVRTLALTTTVADCGSAVQVQTAPPATLTYMGRVYQLAK
jgi:hypothetical protein